MKKIYLLIIGIIMFSCNQGTSTGSEKKQTGEQNLAAVKTIQLNVSGMTCEGCENTVESALTKVDGVVTAEASYVKSVASVSYDTTKVKRELLTETINNLGYHVEN
ncbi:MAG TPA: cation transporter [Lentimicrobium sp.]|nr:cation transporter [Lentimicrobium sp.]